MHVWESEIFYCCTQVNNECITYNTWAVSHWLTDNNSHSFENLMFYPNWLHQKSNQSKKPFKQLHVL